MTLFLAANSSGIKECRFPAAGPFCENDFLSVYSSIMIPLTAALVVVALTTAFNFLTIAFGDLQQLKMSGKEMSWHRLTKRHKLISALNFSGACLAGPCIPFSLSCRSSACTTLMKICFPLGGILSHEGLFFLTLFFFHVQGLLTHDLQSLIQRLRVATIGTMATCSLTGFILNLDTIEFTRVQFCFSGVAFLFNFVLVESYRKKIIQNVQDIKERALLAAKDTSGVLLPTNAAMILESKVNLFLSTSRQHLPPNILMGFLLGISPVMEVFYFLPISVAMIFGWVMTAAFIMCGSMMKKSRTRLVLPFTSFISSKLAIKRTSFGAKSRFGG